MTQTTRSKRLPKAKRAGRQAPRIQLTDRDRAILYDCFHHRFLPASLLCERHFGSITRARTRLRLLFHHGYLDRTFPPTAGPATAEAVYSLGPAAAAELAAAYGLDPADVRRRRKKVEPLFAAHQLLITRFRLAIGHAGAPHGVAVKGWRDEADALLDFEARTLKGQLERVRLTPDGLGWIESKRARFAFCLEADRGTMTVGRVQQKFERYLYAQAAGAVRALIGADRFRVLVVAPSERRLQSLAAAAVRAGSPNAWLATEEALAADPVLDPVWTRAGAEGRYPLFRAEQVFGKRTRQKEEQ
jgi:hypothetical protein